TSSLESLRLDLDKAAKEASEGDLDHALADFDRLSRSPVVGVATDARRQAEYWRRRTGDAEREADDLVERAPRLDPLQADASVDALFEKYGDLLRQRRSDLRSKVEATRGAWIEARRTELSEVVDRLLEEQRFGAAMAI